jgi:hypothetical protein
MILNDVATDAPGHEAIEINQPIISAILKFHPIHINLFPYLSNGHE